jgi:hypothetical protein
MSGSKTFEIRRNDRCFAKGDDVRLMEFTGAAFTGRELVFRIGYVTDLLQQPGYVVFSLNTRLVT